MRQFAWQFVGSVQLEPGTWHACGMWIDQRGSDVLPAPECLRLLAAAAKSGAVGRLAVSRADAPLVVPVNFAYDDHRVVVRLGEGIMSEVAANALVAFETDEVNREERIAWSVLVRGLATPVEASGGNATGTILHLPVPLVPEPGEKLLVIRADVISGRRFALVEG